MKPSDYAMSIVPPYALILRITHVDLRIGDGVVAKPFLFGL